MTIRFFRVLWMFGTIYASYMVQFGLVRVFRRRGQRVPPWLKARRESLDEVSASLGMTSVCPGNSMTSS